MVNLEEKQLQILKKKYSIITTMIFIYLVLASQKIYNLSPTLIYFDIDLFFTESIPENIILQLEEKFEESDLPYQVDLVGYHRCDADFQKILNTRHIQL